MLDRVWGAACKDLPIARAERSRRDSTERIGPTRQDPGAAICLLTMKPHLAARSVLLFLLLGLPLFAQQPAPRALDAPRSSAQEPPAGLSPDDWSSIRAAWEDGRHAARATDEGFVTRTPGQAWTTEFDRDGATTTPDSGGWTWGLELAGFGFQGAPGEVEQAASVSAEGARVSLEWGDGLTEWWINDTRGLEHGFTVHERPDGGESGGPLRFALDVRGGLRPEIVEGRRSARFVDEGGSSALSYSGLVAFDALGQDLDAWMEVADGRLVLCVKECGAAYPITVDPVVQAAYLKASNTDGSDRFGSAVAISGDTVVVGAPLEASNATGVNGGAAAEADNSAQSAGAAYVFTRIGATWSQQAYLKASNTDASDRFGESVAVSGDTVVVGARGERSSATGVNGDQSDNSAQFAGAAYVFTRSGAAWSQQAYLKASNTDQLDQFGGSVAVSGDTVVIGARSESSNATGVNGGAAAEADNSAGSAGAAYVFTRSGATWSQQAYLKASNTDAVDQFGWSVAVSGDTVVVGARSESSNATGVNGGAAAEADNSAGSAGAAYVFTRSGATWSQQAYLKASNTDAVDQFGWSVAVSGDTVVVGAPFEKSNATGVNGGAAAEADNSAQFAGAAFVFTRSSTAWSQQAYVKASNTDADDYFGWSVAVSGDTVVVGADLEDSSATGVNGGAAAEADNSAPVAGAAYVFTRSGAAWSQRAYLKASNTDQLDQFGRSVAVSGDTVVIGARSESSNATGVNGGEAAEADNSATDAGAAYLFDLVAPVTIGSSFCPSNPNSTGVAGEISATGSATAAYNDLTLTASNLPAGQVGIFVTSATTVAGSTVGEGLLCLGGQVSRYNAAGQVLQVDAAGEFSLAVDLTQTPLPSTLTAVMAGDTRSWQAWYRDVGGSGATSNFTSGVTVIWN